MPIAYNVWVSYENPQTNNLKRVNLYQAQGFVLDSLFCLEVELFSHNGVTPYVYLY